MNCLDAGYARWGLLLGMSSDIHVGVVLGDLDIIKILCFDRCEPQDCAYAVSSRYRRTPNAAWDPLERPWTVSDPAPTQQDARARRDRGVLDTRRGRLVVVSGLRYREDGRYSWIVMTYTSFDIQPS